MNKLTISEDKIYTIEKAMNNSTLDNWNNSFFQFVDDFRYSLDESIIKKPGINLEPKLLALYAATTVILCRENNMKVPKWVYSVPKLSDPWFVSGVESLKPMAVLETDPIYKMYNIFVLDNFLVRV